MHFYFFNYKKTNFNLTKPIIAFVQLIDYKLIHKINSNKNKLKINFLSEQIIRKNLAYNYLVILWYNNNAKVVSNENLLKISLENVGSKFFLNKDLNNSSVRVLSFGKFLEYRIGSCL